MADADVMLAEYSRLVGRIACMEHSLRDVGQRLLYSLRRRAWRRPRVFAQPRCRANGLSGHPILARR